MRENVIAVDIGTGSARAGLFDLRGTMLARAEHPILLHRPQENHAEHQSENIWSAVCSAVRSARDLAGVSATSIAAIGFDATCSLVVRDRRGQPLSVNAGSASENDTIVWLDHRAMAEARFCNGLSHPALASSNGRMSPEMQIPKLMWLKKNLGPRWDDVGYLFDLADFLTWRCTDNSARSLCTLTAKWNYLQSEPHGWDPAFLAATGLEDLAARANLSLPVLPVGSPVATLSVRAADELGLDTDCVVGPGMIDAYGGVLGSLGPWLGEPQHLENRFALVGGTSSCVVGLSSRRKSGLGLWGPFEDTLLPGMWLAEGGQSASGALLDFVVRMHASGGEPDAARHQAILDRIDTLRAASDGPLASGLMVVPDFHGNRSPHGDPQSAGIVSGLSLDMSFDGLCKLYFRTAVGIALGMRQVIERLVANGHPGQSLHVSGGHTHNRLLMELYCDVAGLPLVLPPDNADLVLLGTAMAASVSAGLHPSLQQAGQAMAQPGVERLPDPHKKAGYDRDFARFELMQRHWLELAVI